MNFMNFLADVPISLLGDTFDISLNWIGKLVKILISSGVGVGVGVILFSLILKVIVLPFDVFQRIAMRKQNIKMQENKDKMEKLQKQYANDKKMYNQKLMEMQKQSGLTLLSSCLPMILSMVIFFVAIGAFNAYAKFSSVENYNTLVNAYKDSVNEYVVDMDDENSAFSLQTENDKTFIIVKASEEEKDKVIYLKLAVADDKATTLTTAYAQAETAEAKTQVLKDEAKKYDNLHTRTVIDVEKAKNSDTIKGSIDWTSQETIETTLLNFFHGKGAEASKTAYDEVVSSKTKFLWIKNVWATDASYKHPVLSHSDFLKEVAAASCGSSCNSNGKFIVDGEEISVNENGVLVKNDVAVTNVYEENIYNKVTANLGEQKDQANGYFVLIVLSIGTILLQQVITMRSQKEQQKYSSVDGQAAHTQKMTMIIMTVMFGVFSFMYSSAFSIYMIMSNVFSLASTLVINKLVDISEHKKEQKALQEKYNKRLPRTHQNDNKTDKKRK